MSSLDVQTIENVATVKSNGSAPPVFQNTSGTEIGTLCRAWVNFNGTGTVAIRGAFNVSSITDGGVGVYTVNFTTAMTDSNYSTVGSAKTADNSTAGGNNLSFAPYSFNTGSISMLSIDAGNGALKDAAVMTASVFR